MWTLIVLVILLAILPKGRNTKTKRNYYKEYYDDETFDDGNKDLDFNKEDDEAFEDLIMMDEIDDD